MSVPEWYLAVNGQSQGPYAIEDLQGYLQQGQIAPDILVYGPGFSQWPPCTACRPWPGSWGRVPTLRRHRPRRSAPARIRSTLSS